MKHCLLVLTLLVTLAGWSAGEQVPEFTLNNLDGSVFKISDHLGRKTILIDFWATWCGPCKKLLKELQSIHRDFPEVLIVAIAVDNSSTVANVSPYIAAKGFDFTVLLDPESQVVKMFNPEKKIPFSLIVDKAGQVVYVHTGYQPGDEQEIRARLASLAK